MQRAAPAACLRGVPLPRRPDSKVPGQPQREPARPEQREPSAATAVRYSARLDQQPVRPVRLAVLPSSASPTRWRELARASSHRGRASDDDGQLASTTAGGRGDTVNIACRRHQASLDLLRRHSAATHCRHPTPTASPALIALSRSATPSTLVREPPPARAAPRPARRDPRHSRTARPATASDSPPDDTQLVLDARARPRPRPRRPRPPSRDLRRRPPHLQFRQHGAVPGLNSFARGLPWYEASTATS